MPAAFLSLLAVRALVTFAAQMQAVCLGWQMYQLTHDPLHLGLIGLAEAVPALGLSLWAGAIADRRAAVPLYRVVVALTAFSALVFWASTQPWAGAAEIRVSLLYGTAAVAGIARAFSQPTLYAAVPQLVPRDQLVRAAAWMSTTLQVARLSGPAAGGVATAALGAAATGATIGALLLAALGLALAIRPHAGGAPATPPARGLAELLAGARYVFAHPLLLPALTLDMLSVLFGGVTALLPIFAEEVLGVGASGLGLLRAAPAVGAAMGSVALAWRPPGRRAGPQLLAAVAGFGGCVLAFGLSRSLPLSALALGLSGAFDSISVVIRSTAVQLASPAALRGRISAVNAMFIGSSNELGEFESGLAAAALGTVPSVVVGGGLCLAVVMTVAWRFPALRRLDLTAVDVTPAA